MKSIIRTLSVGLIAGGAILLSVTPASAGNVSWAVSVGVPAPVIYSAPQPVVYSAPPPVYYPAPAAYPAPVVYSAPAYPYAPAQVVYVAGKRHHPHHYRGRPWPPAHRHYY